ncbi:MAG: NAD(P)-dependent alcohol dehydrogenase [Alphaproteobacteria bacterium]
MKAAVYRQYGSPNVVHIEDVAKPEPKNNEVLVKIRATTVSAADWRIRSLTVPKGFGLIIRLFFGVLRPRQPILGTELAGEIEAVGKDVTKFKVGDAVFAYPGAELGSHAKYRTMPEDGRIALKPANLSFEEAAALSFGGATALYFLRDVAKLQKSESVLVVGASGSVGSAAVQLAKHFGAEVTGICSTANVELVKSIGADRVIDYTKEDYKQGGERYDVIFDTVGETPLAKNLSALKAGGRLALIAANLPQILATVWRSKSDQKKVFAGPATESPEQLQFLKDLSEAGKFKPVIDQRFPLESIALAHARVDSRRKTGNVIVTVP